MSGGERVERARRAVERVGGRAVSANAEAISWLRELWPMAREPTTELDSLDVFEMRDIDLGVPTALFALVSSRGELVARLFAEHYSDPLHTTMVHAE